MLRRLHLSPEAASAFCRCLRERGLRRAQEGIPGPGEYLPCRHGEECFVLWREEGSEAPPIVVAEPGRIAVEHDSPHSRRAKLAWRRRKSVERAQRRSRGSLAGWRTRKARETNAR